MTHTTVEYILSHFHSSVHGALKGKAKQMGATHIVLASNIKRDSPHFGACTVICVGPLCVYKTLADCEGGWLYDTPDRRQTFTHYSEVPANWQEESVVWR